MDKEYDTWVQRNWRPMMAIVFMIIILFDFVFAPILWSLLHAFVAGTFVAQWSPLTLVSGGLFYAAMGAVLGVSAFTRGQEKVERLRRRYQEGESKGPK